MPASPRSEIIEDGVVGLYHCINRCVRRAHLCGVDQTTGNNYDYRKKWIHTRLSHLKKVFAVQIASYSVMSNHIHLLLKNRPDLALKMDDIEILERWWELYPRRKSALTKGEFVEMHRSDQEFISVRRNRLSSLSWFMKALTEPIARRANKEDNVTGHFWQGRFISKRVLDTEGAIATNVYIDLNPLKARAVNSLEESVYTSIRDRIKHLASGIPCNLLLPIAEVMKGISEDAPFLLEDESDYVEYVRRSAEKLVANNRSTTIELEIVESHSSVIGTSGSIAKEAIRRNRRWLR